MKTRFSLMALFFACVVTFTTSSTLHATTFTYDFGDQVGAAGTQLSNDGWIGADLPNWITSDFSGDTYARNDNGGDNTITRPNDAGFSFNISENETFVSLSLVVRAGVSQLWQVGISNGTNFLFGLGADNDGTNRFHIFDGNTRLQETQTNPGNAIGDQLVTLTVEADLVAGTADLILDGENILNDAVLNNVTAATLATADRLSIRTTGATVGPASFIINVGIPEPSTGLLIGMGLVGIVMRRRRNRRKPVFSNAVKAHTNALAMALLVGCVVLIASSPALAVPFPGGNVPVIHYTFETDTLRPGNQSVDNQGVSGDDDPGFFNGTVVSTGGPGPGGHGFLNQRNSASGVQVGDSVNSSPDFTVAGFYRGTDTTGRFLEYGRNLGVPQQFRWLIDFDVINPGFVSLGTQRGVNGFVTHETTLETSRIADGEWHHLAVTWESGVEFKIYLDGVLEDTVALPSAESLQFLDSGSPEVLTFGAAGGGINPIFGDYDELQIFGAVLSEAEVAFVANFVPEPSTGLLLSFGLFGLMMRRKTRSRG